MICLSFNKITLAAGLEVDSRGPEQRQEAKSVFLLAQAGDDGGSEKMASMDVVRVAGFQICFEEIARRCWKKASEEVKGDAKVLTRATRIVLY